MSRLWFKNILFLPGGAQGLLLALCSGITPGCVQETIWDPGDQTCIDCARQMPYPLCYHSGP